MKKIVWCGVELAIKAIDEKPEKNLFTKAEWQLGQKLNTPARVQRFLTRMPYNWGRNVSTLRSFREMTKRNEVHCVEAAVGAAVHFEQHGYPPQLLHPDSQELPAPIFFGF